MTNKQAYSADAVEKLVQEFIENEFLYDKPELSLDNDFHLIETGIIDSMGIFRLIGFLEETFNITLKPEEVLLENFENLNAIKELVKSRTEAQPESLAS